MIDDAAGVDDRARAYDRTRIDYDAIHDDRAGTYPDIFGNDGFLGRCAPLVLPCRPVGNAGTKDLFERVRLDIREGESTSRSRAPDPNLEVPFPQRREHVGKRLERAYHPGS